jgi:hypothetical protein
MFYFFKLYLFIGKRTLLDSLSTFETKLNRALEQNALLENELDEKQQVLNKIEKKNPINYFYFIVNRNCSTIA